LRGDATIGDDFATHVVLRRIARAVAVLAMVIVVGTLGYVVLEGWSLLDALYMTVITIGSAGFEEVRDLSNNPSGRIWTMVVLLAGIGSVAFVVSSLVQVLVEGTVTGYFRRRRMEKMIDRLTGHYLVCGFGRVGREAAGEFRAEEIPFVVIDQDESVIRECEELGYLAVLGNASDDDVLATAGIADAKGLVAAVDSDADNVFVVLSARRANPKLRIVARTDSEESSNKLRVAGADRTLSPYAVGGKRLARLAAHPSVVEYLDFVTQREQGPEFRLEELQVSGGSDGRSRRFGELRGIEGEAGARILAIKRGDNSFNVTPSEQDEIFPGDSLIVLGSPEQVRRMEVLIGQ
jgi:voltage-gated potassium channel